VVRAACYLDSVHYIVHRDIAARNFLVTQHLTVKLADFGRARYVYDDDYEGSSAELISVKWASPEVLVRSRYSTRSDVWATGVVMWEILTHGERPYSGLSAEQTAVYVLNGGRLRQPDDCGPRLWTVVSDCWQHRATDRPSSRQLAERLADVSRFAVADHHKPASSAAAAGGSVSAQCSELDAVDERSTASSSSSATSRAQRTSSADDLLSRGHKIRHSLRQLVNMKL